MGTDAPHPKYLVVNADEMEPGTFKDRLLMEGDPHQLIEGMILRAYADRGGRRATSSSAGEYKLAARAARAAIAEAYAARLPRPEHLGSATASSLPARQRGPLHLRRGDRAAQRARRASARIRASKPPFPAVSGLWGKPTIVNNVETLCNVPHIVAARRGLVQGPEPHARRRHEALRRRAAK